jgi:hypothetical protein
MKYMPRPSIYTDQQPFLLERNATVDSLIYGAMKIQLSDIQLETAVNFMDRFLGSFHPRDWQGNVLSLGTVCLNAAL